MKTFSKILKITGASIMFVGVLGGIVGSFGYDLELNGSQLPHIDWSIAAILMAIGAVFYFIGHLLTKKYGEIDVADDVQVNLDMNNLGFITKALKKTRKRNLFMGIFMCLFGIPMLIFPALLDEGTGVTIGLGIFGGICLLIGIMGFVQFNKLRDLETSETYKLIMHTPQKITGLTALIIKSGFGKIGQAINATIIVDKKNKAVLSVTEDELELLRQYLVKHNPNLEFEKKIQQA